MQCLLPSPIMFIDIINMSNQIKGGTFFFKNYIHIISLKSSFNSENPEN